jgi:hypothetical protein
MIPPSQAAWQFAMACLYGLGLGTVYDILRPLRPKRTALADALFLPVLFYTWLHLSFQICQGDPRLGISGGLFVGMGLWRVTLSKPFRQVFLRFLIAISGLLAWITLPLRKIFQKIYKIIKFFFASWKKWVTIKWTNRRHTRRRTGGPHGKIQKPLGRHQTGMQKNLDTDQDRCVDSYRIVYRRPSDAPWCH